MANYRYELIRPGKLRHDQTVGERHGTATAQAWLFFSTCSVMMAIFGYMFENTRMSLCGFYLLFDLSHEIFDYSRLGWYERRQCIYEQLIELSFSSEDKKAPLKDENGRLLPQWLQQAEEKEMKERQAKLPQTSKHVLMVHYSFHYALKIAVLKVYYEAFH